MCNRDSGRHPSARRNPLVIGLKLDANLVVVDPQVAVLTTHDGLRHSCLHFLRHHTDVSSIAAIIAEAIVAKAVGEMAEKDNIVLERDIGSSPAAAAATTTTTHARATTATAHACATTAAAGAETCVSARGLGLRYSAGLNVSKSVATASACRPRTRPLSSARPLDSSGTGTRPLSGAGASTWTTSAATITKIGLAAARSENLFAAAAAEIHSVLASAP